MLHGFFFYNMATNTIPTELMEDQTDLLSTLLDNLPDHVYFKDRDAHFVRFSKSLLMSLGLDDPEQLRGKTDFDFFEEEDARQFQNDEQRILETGEPLLGIVEKERRLDGRVTWALTTKMPWRDRVGNILGTFGVSKDISDLVKADHALKKSQAYYKALVESIPMNIIRKDREGRFSFVNDRVCSLLGKRPEQIIGKTDFDLFPHELATKYREDDVKVMESGEPLKAVENHMGPANDRLFVEIIKTPLHSPEGKVDGIQVVFWDVTERERAAERVEAMRRELMEASRQAGMAEIATGVLHNVGNVLNSVNVSANVLMEQARNSRVSNVNHVAALLREHTNVPGFLQDDPKGAQIPEYLTQLGQHLTSEQEESIRELKSLAGNIDHIKDIVAMQQSYARISGVRERVHVSELVDDALRLNAGTLLRHDVHVEREFETDSAMEVEKHKVLQILVNLIRNAKYACDESNRKDKKLTLRVGESDGWIRIHVKDNGVGISAENLTRIFGLGFTTRPSGHGFGLHNAALAARELGGQLTVHSDGVGKGAEFILEIPSVPDSSSTSPT